MPLIGIAVLWSVGLFWLQRRLGYPVTGLDLGVYLRGGQAVLDGAALHGSEFQQILVRLWSNHATSLAVALPFTYPPFAALLFSLLTLVGFTAAFAIMTVLHVGAAWVIASFVVRQIGWSPRRRWVPSLALTPAVLMMTPAFESTSFGQVSFLVTAALVYEVSRRESNAGGAEDTAAVDTGRQGAKLVGFLTGVATAVKLTPGLLIVHWWITRQWCRAVIATVTTALCWLFALIVLPADTLWYFSHLGALDARGQGDGNPYNVATVATFARITGLSSSTALLAVGGLVIVIAALVVARRLHRRGDIVASGIVVIGAASLAAPVGWVHTAGWVIPAVAVIAARLEQRTKLLVLTAGFALASIPARLPALEAINWLFWPVYLLAVWFALAVGGRTRTADEPSSR